MKLPFLPLAAALIALLPCSRLAGQDARVVLNGPPGATLVFDAAGTGWRWTGLTTPAAPDGVAIIDEGTPIATATDNDRLAADWILVEQSPEQLIFEQDLATARLRWRRVFSFGPAANVARIETWVQSRDGRQTLKRAGLLDVSVGDEAFQEKGNSPVSFPLFGRSLFVGVEHVTAECHADGSRAHLWQTPNLAVGDAWQFVAAVVIGWPQPAVHSLNQGDWRMRQAFLDYLDTVRIKPRDLELHTNTWWTLPVPFSEQDVLKDIEALRTGFTERTGMFFDSYALDLGWSDPHSIWRADAKRFPNGFRTINERLAELGCRLGLWVSPGSAYPPGLDNAWLKSQGYELTPFGNPGDRIREVACFALGGRYQTEFKKNIVAYAAEYGLGHVKLDFMAHSCAVASHGHPTGVVESFTAIDAGLADVLDSLRAVNPRMALEPLVCGYPPSPWWTTKTPYVVGPAGDDVPYGRVPCPEWIESLITARDIAYRGAQEAWLMPTQALETFDIVVQTPGDFENLAAMAIGRGRWFISTYLRPEYMRPEHWDFLAALVRWARANKQYLGNARMFGGAPAKREPYGYMFHNADKDIYCIRNPWIDTVSIELPTCSCVTASRDLRLIYPRRSTLARLEPAGDRPRVVLGPYETLVLESTAAGEITITADEATRPIATVSAAPPAITLPASDANDNRTANLEFAWSGTVNVPAVDYAELCLLVEGAPAVGGSTCYVSLGGRSVKARRAASAGQFGAAGDPSPDNWAWFIVPLPAGESLVQVDVLVPDSHAAIGLYLRGLTSAPNEAVPDGVPAFPLFHPGLRTWSQTVVPRTLYAAEDQEGDTGSAAPAGHSPAPH